LSLAPRNAPWNTVLFDALKLDGFIAGQNLTVDDQGFSLRVDQLAEHASAIVEAKVDLIFCGGTLLSLPHSKRRERF
jgi:histone acetyltransferase (RNA polymerase elongator complex component)